jgi:acetolactate synthase-1/3 small subunit
MNQPASAYFLEERHDPTESHTLSVLVQNEPGVLARVIGLFSGRGYNIESLTVSETESQKHLSRITIVTTGTPMVIEQIKHQLDRMVPVYRVVDMTLAGRSIERELAMVKVRGGGDNRVEALRLADAFRARVIDATTESFVFEITGGTSKIDQFVALMLPLGLIDVSRTGIVAIGALASCKRRRGPMAPAWPRYVVAGSGLLGRPSRSRHAATKFLLAKPAFSN